MMSTLPSSPGLTTWCSSSRNTGIRAARARSTACSTKFVRDALHVQQGEVRAFHQFTSRVRQQVSARSYGAVPESVCGGRARVAGVEGGTQGVEEVAAAVFREDAGLLGGGPLQGVGGVPGNR